MEKLSRKDKRSVICRLISDICIIGSGGIVLLLFKLVGSPYQRGFFCDDQSLMYPFHSSTVTSGMLYGIGFALAVFLFLVIEGAKVFKGYNTDTQTIEDMNKYGKLTVFIRNFYITLAPFLFGAVVEHIITDIGKYSIGRLRPHFRDVCRLNVSTLDCSKGYVTDFDCTGEDKGLIREMRLSFPSGHSSFSVYVAVYLVVYIQRRARCSLGLLIGPLVQVAVTLMAWYTCLSRVMNNKHHPTDVIAGAIIGAVTALTVAYCVSSLFERTKPEGNWESKKSLDNKDIEAPESHITAHF